MLAVGGRPVEPAVLTGLAAVSRVSRALAGADELSVLAAAALHEMRATLGYADYDAGARRFVAALRANGHRSAVPA